MGYKNTYTDKVRKLFLKLGKGGVEVTHTDLEIALDLITKADKKPMYSALYTMRGQKEIERVRPGVHRLVNKKIKPNKQQQMWSFLRSKRTVSIEDLMEASEAKRDYVREFLQALVRNESVRKLRNGKYQLVKDTVTMPQNEEKTARLRRIRVQAALKKLDEAYLSIIKARLEVAELKK